MVMDLGLLSPILDWIVANPGWMHALVFLTALTESLVVAGLIVPGALMMFAFGALIALGHLDFWQACLWAVLGAIVGDGLSFWIGWVLKDRMRSLWPLSRHPELIQRGETYFYRHGGKSIFLGRFVGPVRPVIPAVAGMLRMPVSRFLAANSASALVWAPAYLLPGMAFAASLELAAQVTWRLALLILLLIALGLLTVWLVRTAYRLLAPLMRGWLQRYERWSRAWPWLGPLSRSLLDPARGDLTALATVAMVLIMGGILGGFVMLATGQALPTNLDIAVYQAFQALRTPLGDRIMIIATEMGDLPVKTALTATVAGWLWYRRAPVAAVHWLAAVLFAVVSNTVFKLIFQVPRPLTHYDGLVLYAFPSNHATLSTVLFGFLAVLAARETVYSRRWLVYTAAALATLPVVISRLYLGVHWLSDTLAGVCLGMIWVGVAGLAYYRHARVRIERGPLLLVAVLALVISHGLYARFAPGTDPDRYRRVPQVVDVPSADWWQGQWQWLPEVRVDMLGQRRQPMSMQWAAAPAEIRTRLLGAGWRPAEPFSATLALQWLNPRVTLEELPVLPRVHGGQYDELRYVRQGNGEDERWILRLWDTGWRLDGATPLWLGSVHAERLERRFDFFTLAVPDPDRISPVPLLAEPLAGLHTALEQTPGGPILLVPPAGFEPASGPVPSG